MREQTAERMWMNESDGQWAGLQDNPREQPVEYSSSPSQPLTLKTRDRLPLNVVLLKLLPPTIAQT